MSTGIVVVSHSRALADAAVALAREMVPGAAVEVAAGLDDATFGTDAVAIREAIGRADDGGGVVVLMDLGSAVLSAELALELMGEDERGRVVLCPAPFVEGLVVAAVAAAGGALPDAVAAEALAALEPKRIQLGVPAATVGPVVATTAVASGVFVVDLPHGLHARPAARLVQAIRGFDAEVSLRNRSTGAGPASAASLLRIATLGVLPGHEVEVAATGAQAREAVDGVLALARDRFGEA